MPVLTARPNATPRPLLRHGSVHRRLALLCALIGPTLAVPAASANETNGPDRARIASDTVENVMRPAYAALADDALELARRTEASCTGDVATDERADARSLTAAWTAAVTSLSGIEFLRIGPLLDDNRLNRLFYWPDKRRAGERQLRELLSEPAGSISAESMAARSVAVQGFPALERLLFPNGEVAISEARCATAVAVAGHMAAISTALDRAWQAEDGIARQMSEPRADDELLRSHDEVLRRVATQLSTGLEIVLDRKLGPVLDGESARLRGLPFVRSGTLPAHLEGNIAALQALMLDSGLAEAAGLADELAFEFRIANGHLERLGTLLPPAPPAVVGESGTAVRADEWPQALDDPQAGVVRALHSVMSSIRDTLRERLLPTLGIRTGFNSEDGD